MTDVGKIVFLNNTSGNNFKNNNKISKYNYLYTNLWTKKEIDHEDYFKLIHLESKKFLTASPNGLTLEVRGMYNCTVKWFLGSKECYLNSSLLLQSQNLLKR